MIKKTKLLLAISLASICRANVTEYDSGAKSHAGPVVIKFYSTHCGPCKSLAPLYKKIASDPKYAGVKFYQADIEKNHEAEKVRTNLKGKGLRGGVPSIVFFKSGKDIASDNMGVDPVVGYSDDSNYPNTITSRINRIANIRSTPVVIEEKEEMQRPAKRKVEAQPVKKGKKRRTAPCAY